MLFFASKLLMYFNFDLPDSNQLSDQSTESQVTSVTAALYQSNHDGLFMLKGTCPERPWSHTANHPQALDHWLIG